MAHQGKELAVLMATKKLSCGGKGPCCHIGYSHRHCEHCDTVISLVSFTWPYYNPVYPRPYQPYWATNGVGDNSAGLSNFVDALNSARATTADQSHNALSLPAPTAAHACEVKPTG